MFLQACITFAMHKRKYFQQCQLVLSFYEKIYGNQNFQVLFCTAFCFILLCEQIGLMFLVWFIVNKVLNFNPFIIQSNHIVSEDFIQVKCNLIELVILAKVSILLLHWKKENHMHLKINEIIWLRYSIWALKYSFNLVTIFQRHIIALPL